MLAISSKYFLRLELNSLISISSSAGLVWVLSDVTKIPTSVWPMRPRILHAFLEYNPILFQFGPVLYVQVFPSQGAFFTKHHKDVSPFLSLGHIGYCKVRVNLSLKISQSLILSSAFQSICGTMYTIHLP